MGAIRNYSQAAILLGLSFVVLFLMWIVLGPGGQWVVLQFTTAQGNLRVVGDWYQTNFDGLAKLIAPLITIVTGSYAIYKGYRHAESRLHLRLSDFLSREEK